MSGNSNVWRTFRYLDSEWKHGMGKVWKESQDFIQVSYGLTAFLYRCVHINVLKRINVEHYNGSNSLKCTSFLFVEVLVHCIGVIRSSLHWLMNWQLAQIPDRWGHFHGQQCPFFWLSTSISPIISCSQNWFTILSKAVVLVHEEAGSQYMGNDSNATSQTHSWPTELEALKPSVSQASL